MALVPPGSTPREKISLKDRHEERRQTWLSRHCAGRSQETQHNAAATPDRWRWMYPHRHPFGQPRNPTPQLSWPASGAVSTSGREGPCTPGCVSDAAYATQRGMSHRQFAAGRRSQWAPLAMRPSCRRRPLLCRRQGLAGLDRRQRSGVLHHPCRRTIVPQPGGSVESHRHERTPPSCKLSAPLIGKMSFRLRYRTSGEGNEHEARDGIPELGRPGQTFSSCLCHVMMCRWKRLSS
eukprot:352965-Chlamydomonas_euryale.AAC.3